MKPLKLAYVRQLRKQTRLTGFKDVIRGKYFGLSPLQQALVNRLYSAAEHFDMRFIFVHHSAIVLAASAKSQKLSRLSYTCVLTYSAIDVYAGVSHSVVDMSDDGEHRYLGAITAGHCNATWLKYLFTLVPTAITTFEGMREAVCKARV